MDNFMTIAALRAPYPDDPKDLDLITWHQIKSRMRAAASEIENLQDQVSKLEGRIEEMDEVRDDDILSAIEARDYGMSE